MLFHIGAEFLDFIDRNHEVPFSIAHRQEWFFLKIYAKERYNQHFFFQIVPSYMKKTCSEETSMYSIRSRDAWFNVYSDE